MKTIALFLLLTACENTHFSKQKSLEETQTETPVVIGAKNKTQDFVMRTDTHDGGSLEYGKND